MSAMESQKVAEDSQNSKNIYDSRWSVVLSDQNNFLEEEMLLSPVWGWRKDNREFSEYDYCRKFVVYSPFITRVFRINLLWFSSKL